MRNDATTDYYELVQREASAEILPSLRTRIRGYNGTFPGPTAAGVATLGRMMWAPIDTAQATQKEGFSEVAPFAVFQAAGPNAASIQSSVDEFRAALGGINNGNAPGQIATGRREINWDVAPQTDGCHWVEPRRA